MKLTLLELTQDILNDLDSDPVNSIDDTVESEQIAQIIKTTYFAIIDGRNWPHTKKLVEIKPSGNFNLPTVMYLQDEVKEITLVNYDKAKAGDGARRKFDEVRYLDPDDFLRLSNSRDNTQSQYNSMTDPESGILFTIQNNLAPTYYTSFNDKTLVFDSYDASLEDTLQKHKVQVYAYVTPSWSHTDDAYPNLPDKAFTLLLEEAKSRASMKVRQQPDQKAEQEAQRQRKWLARTDKRVAQGIKFPDYGRGRSGGALNYRKNCEPTFRNEN